MDLDNIKKIPNPYESITTNLNQYEFIGRQREIKVLQNILEDYKKTYKLKNILINGEKSIGKSSLMNRYKQILNDYKFEVFEYELPIDPTVHIDEFVFFKELINQLFIKYSEPEGSFFDARQSEIWFHLVSDKYQHDSNVIERELQFATTYSNKMNGIDEILSVNQLLEDFKKIFDKLLLNEMEVFGLAILIDEFQELQKNSTLLNILRIISEQLTGIMIIGAGLPTYLNNPSFEKFSRTSKTIILNSMDKNEILEMIYQPLQKCTNLSRYESKQLFEVKSVYEIINRSVGNPLHIRIICAKMFDYFKNNFNSKWLSINKEVMDDVMEYYSSISDKSRRIKQALESCSRDDLKIFNHIFGYEGLSFRSSIFLELAFNSIQKEALEEKRKEFIDEFMEIYDYNLFKIENGIDIKELPDTSINALSNIKYKFIGDSIDKLYVYYFYEDLTGNVLNINENSSFEDLISEKLAKEISKIIVKKKVPDVVFEREDFYLIESENDNIGNIGEEFINDLNELRKIKIDRNDEKKMKIINDISSKHNLEFPAHIASLFEYEGYYVLFTVVKIRGKTKILRNYFPVRGNIKIVKEIRERISDYSDYINASLDDYMISVECICLYWLPKQPLLHICYIDLKNENDILYNMTIERNFEEAIIHAKRILSMNTIIRKDSIGINIEALNNYGFCLINTGEYEKAQKEFESVKEKYLLSNINLAFVHVCKKEFNIARNILKKLFRKNIGKDHEAAILHLAICHPQITPKNIIVEDVNIFNVIAWNLALICSLLNENEGIINQYLNKVTVFKNERLIDKRVRNWIDYYKNKFDFAFKNTKILQEECKETGYLFNDVSKDYEIFKNALSN